MANAESSANKRSVGLAVRTARTKNKSSSATRLYRRNSAVFWPILTIAILLVFWEVGSRLAAVPEYILPVPTKVAVVAWEQKEYLIWQAGVTTIEILIAFWLSLVVGFVLAVLIMESKIFEQSIYPILVFSQAVPKVAIAPLFLIWFGFGLQSKILVAFLIAFFPVVIDTAAGIQSVPVSMRDLARSMGATRLQTLRMFILPHALPNFFAGLKVAITLAVVGAVVGEFVGSDKGLGYVILLANGRMDTPVAFAAILVLSAIAILLFYVVVFFEKLFLPWHVSTQDTANARL